MTRHPLADWWWYGLPGLLVVLRFAVLQELGVVPREEYERTNTGVVNRVLFVRFRFKSKATYG